ncbi:MAG: hypothetical protein WC261_07925 [Synergistaceae bacterium]|jgi:hypothetical protein
MIRIDEINGNIQGKMDETIQEIKAVFGNEPLDEYAVDKLADLFKVKLNLRMGNLTEEEAASGIRNIDNCTVVKECMFVSEWDDGCVIKTWAGYNIETGQVYPEEAQSLPGKGAALEEEYIDIVLNGRLERKNVCPECHGYTLVTYPDEHCSPVTECPGCGYEED